MYKILNEDKPLFNFEEGPLPLSLIEDYKLRGWNNDATTEHQPLDDSLSPTTIDPRRNALNLSPDGGIIETQYYVNGTKAIEIQKNADGTAIKTQYHANGEIDIEIHENPDGSMQQNEYDINGKLITEIETNSEGYRIIKEYNDNGTKIETKINSRGAGTKTEFNLDGSQKITTHDSSGNIISKQHIQASDITVAKPNELIIDQTSIEHPASKISIDAIAKKPSASNNSHTVAKDTDFIPKNILAPKQNKSLSGKPQAARVEGF